MNKPRDPNRDRVTTVRRRMSKEIWHLSQAAWVADTRVKFDVEWTGVLRLLQREYISMSFLLPSRLALSALSLAATLVTALPTQASAQPTIQTDPATPVVTIVRVPKPWYAPRSTVTAKMIESLPIYLKLDGLAFKAYSFERNTNEYGGVYYWDSKQSAERWYNAAWFERVKRERGVDGKVRYLEAPLTIDNVPGGTAEDNASESVTTLVEIPIPAGLSREKLIAEFNAAMPTYQRIPGLLRKSFVLTSNNTFGGVYLWKNEASANAWFNTAWHERVQKTYGQAAAIEWYDTPILMHSKAKESTIAASAFVGAK
jgi:heme-degrading monooxygenase HmoA